MLLGTCSNQIFKIFLPEFIQPQIIPDKKRNAYSDIFPFSLPFLVQVV